MIMLAKGNRTKQVTDACKEDTAGSIWDRPVVLPPGWDRILSKR
jgi:hypothetical protein